MWIIWFLLGLLAGWFSAMFDTDIDIRPETDNQAVSRAYGAGFSQGVERFETFVDQQLDRTDLDDEIRRKLEEWKLRLELAKLRFEGWLANQDWWQSTQGWWERCKADFWEKDPEQRGFDCFGIPPETTPSSVY